MSRITLVGHGQGSFAAEEYDVLSDLGIAQARRFGESLRDQARACDIVIVGRMRRHQDTARHCLDAWGKRVKVVEYSEFDQFNFDEILRRYDPLFSSHSAFLTQFGSVDGDPTRVLYPMLKCALERWSSGAFDQDNSETWSEFLPRSRQAIPKAAYLGRTAAIAVCK